MGRPRIYENRAHKQSAYRRRKEEKDFDTRQLAAQAEAVIKAARDCGMVTDATLPGWKVLEVVAGRLAGF